MHVDSVPVHVDFTIGTSSVLTDGALTAGQQVVIDGQEKLVDGSPVTVVQPKQQGGRAGASGATGSSGAVGDSGATSSAGTHSGGHGPVSPNKGHGGTQQ
jgi:hypothetical protein